MDVGQAIAEQMAEMSEIGAEGRFPRIRNLIKVPVTEEQRVHPAGYSFEFEAFIDGEWVKYGPNCYGNWTCKQGYEGLPDTQTLHFNQCFPEERRPYNLTVGIGWYTLNRLHRALEAYREQGNLEWALDLLEKGEGN